MPSHFKTNAQALSKERNDRQRLAGQLEVVQAELEASKSAAKRAQMTRLAEAQEMSARWDGMSRTVGRS